MIALTSRISILIDIAGMDKSTVLNHLARKWKKTHPNYWIVKIDLNELDKIEIIWIKLFK
jgi:hypothetical protein